jgi:hypothetical protein
LRQPANAARLDIDQALAVGKVLGADSSGQDETDLAGDFPNRLQQLPIAKPLG